MKVTIDYTLDVRKKEIQPISVAKKLDEINVLYKYDDYYIEVTMFLNSRGCEYNGLVFKNKEFYKLQQIDGKNVISTNFNITYDELVKEIEIALGMIEGTIKYSELVPDISVNKAY